MHRRLSVTTEKRIERALTNKRLSAGMETDIKSRFKLQMIKKMFDQFFIVGAPPQFNFQPRPTILVSYPTHAQNSRREEEMDLITSFCFPTGLPKFPPTINKNRVIINEYTFSLAEGVNRIYGICVLMKGTPKSFFISEKSQHYPFCLCFLTSTPFLTAHFQFLTYLAFRLTGRVKPSPHLNETDIIPSFYEAHIPPGLVKDEEFPSVAIFSGMKATQMFVEELNFYMSLPTNLLAAGLQHGEVYPTIHLSNLLPLSLPLHFSEEQNIAHATFHAIFSCLSVENIVKIFTAILCEEHVLFISENIHKLTLIVQGFVSMISPFEAMATMVLPIIPNEPRFLEFLESPCPYIVGVASPNKDFELLVNIDTNTLVEKLKIPALPKADVLIDAINKILTDSKDLITPPPKYEMVDGVRKKTKEFTDFFMTGDNYLFPLSYLVTTDVKLLLTSKICDDILSTISNHLPSYLNEGIKECFVTDTTDALCPITVFNKDLYMYNIPDEDIPFFTTFFQTQIWEVYCDKISNAYAEEKKTNSMTFISRTKSNSGLTPVPPVRRRKRIGEHRSFQVLQPSSV